MAAASAEVDRLRQNLSHGKTPVVADGIDLATIPIEVLDIYKLALAPVSFSKDRLAAKPEEAGHWTKMTPLGEVIRDANAQGSNNWVIAADRTETGRPILANDPHRAHAVPSLRYIVHLSSPEFDGIGAGEPVLPGIMIGHNGTIAFGLTLSSARTRRTSMSTRRAGKSRPLSLRRRLGGHEGRHRDREGEGSADDRRHAQVHAPRPRDPRGTGEPARLCRALGLVRAWRLALMRSASRRCGGRTSPTSSATWSAGPYPRSTWSTPIPSGDIAWIVAGQSPIRPNWDGLTPVPGDGRFEWDGFYTSEHLPAIGSIPTSASSPPPTR